MNPTDPEWERSLEDGKMLQVFLSSYTGSADDLEASWLRFKGQPHPRADAATPTRKVAHDVQRHEPREHAPNVDELIGSAERILRVYEDLHGAHPANLLTVGNKYRFREEGDVYQPPPLPGTVGLLASLPSEEECLQIMSERAKADIEEKLEARREACKTSLQRVLEERENEANRHRSVL
jgi:hypothetical protein